MAEGIEEPGNRKTVPGRMENPGTGHDAGIEPEDYPESPENKRTEIR